MTEKHSPLPGEIWRVEYEGVAADVRIDHWDDWAQQWVGYDELDGASWGLTKHELRFRVAPPSQKGEKL